MNTAAVYDPDLKKQTSNQFGPEKTIVAIDVRKNESMTSSFELVVSGGTKPVNKDAVQRAKKCKELGGGALLPASIDRDGTQIGYDLALTKAISDAVQIPIIASGGAWTLEQFYDGVIKGGAQILLADSVFHYRILRISQVKGYLKDRGIKVIL